MSDTLFQWTQPLDSLRHQFEHARPFRHLALDHVLHEEFLREAIGAFPPIEAMERRVESAHDKKTQSNHVDRFAPVLKVLHDAVSNPLFLEELSDITGIPSLVADPELYGGGIHQGGDGSFIDTHVDQNVLPERGLHRRLNLVLYLNPQWRREWGGSLELWNQDLTRAETLIDPKANRCVIFETTDRSYHGYRRVSLPKGSELTRKSFSAYYYTAEAPAGVESLPETVYVETTARPAYAERAKNLNFLAPIRQILSRPGMA